MFGAGYVTQAEWWKIGFIMSVIYLAIWLFIGPLWWTLLGTFRLASSRGRAVWQTCDAAVYWRYPIGRVMWRRNSPAGHRQFIVMVTRARLAKSPRLI